MFNIEWVWVSFELEEDPISHRDEEGGFIEQDEEEEEDYEEDVEEYDRRQM